MPEWRHQSVYLQRGSHLRDSPDVVRRSRRPTTITEQDQSVKTADYSAGNCVTSFDEANTQRKGCSDALGRLLEVDEPNPGAGATLAGGSVIINGNE